jgi:hypothetical protein
MELRQGASSSRILVAAEFLDDSGEALSPFRVYEASGRNRRCETVSIFKVDCGSVKLPFREVDASALKSVAAQET